MCDTGLFFTRKPLYSIIRPRNLLHIEKCCFSPAETAAISNNTRCFSQVCWFCLEMVASLSSSGCFQPVVYLPVFYTWRRIKSSAKPAKCGCWPENSPKRGATWCEKLIQTALFRESPSKLKCFDQIGGLWLVNFHPSARDRRPPVAFRAKILGNSLRTLRKIYFSLNRRKRFFIVLIQFFSSVITPEYIVTFRRVFVRENCAPSLLEVVTGAWILVMTKIAILKLF